MQTLSVSRLTSKSQATIPDRVRRKLGLKPGDSVAFKFKDGHVYLQKARPSDRVFAKAVEDTLKDEWHSAPDDRAYAVRYCSRAGPVHGQCSYEAPPRVGAFNDRIP